MAGRLSARSRALAKRVLPDRAIEVLRAVRTSVQSETWTETSESLLDPSLRRLAYWPGGRQNPYLRLLYARVPEVGHAARALVRYSDLETLPADDVFHLHWTRGAQLGATSRATAETMTADYLRPIEGFVERGGTLLWSVHEEVPHDCDFPDVEVRLRSRLAELAAGIHVLHASTPASVEPLYRLPADKTFVVEHPLYTGYYPSYVTRDTARRMLGVPGDGALIVGFGAIRPYKGFDRLVDVAATVEHDLDRPVHVLIAGPTMAHADIADLEAKASASPRVTLSAGPVPDDQVQLLMTAADVVALPYRRVMNSGVLMLALTFARRCVAPDNPITRDAAASGLVELFEPGSDAALAAAIHRALSAPSGGELPEGFVSRYDPRSVAGEFATHLRTIVTRGHS